jgi:hypothetical protein
MAWQRIILWSCLVNLGEALVLPSTRRSLGVASSRTFALNAHQNHQNQPQPTTTNLVASNLVAASIAIAASSFIATPPPAVAYEPTDYASETVQETLQALKSASGNLDATFKSYEAIAAIVTEGKGVGGQINYQGIALERGYVADEDTSIYNPGLTLLTESEKERLVEGLVNSRKAGMDAGQWNENNEFAYVFLKEKLDPLHMFELSGYLGFVPIYGAVLYLGVLAVQQFVRDLFPGSYIVGAVLFFVPIFGLIALS